MFELLFRRRVLDTFCSFTLSALRLSYSLRCLIAVLLCCHELRGHVARIVFDWKVFSIYTGVTPYPIQQIQMKKKIRQVLKALLPYQPERIFLFGSWARGEEDELSDLDLVVIKQTEAPFWDRLREVASLLPPDIGGVDILVYTPDEFGTMQREGNAFAEMISEEARLIYDHQEKN